MQRIFYPTQKATLLIPQTGPTHDPNRSHLFIVLTDICADKKNLLVPICSVRSVYDTTCVLRRGDHRFIKWDSFVDYANADIRLADTLIKGVKRGEFSYKGSIGDTVFQRVCTGVETSPLVRNEILTYYMKNK